MLFSLCPRSCPAALPGTLLLVVTDPDRARHCNACKDLRTLQWQMTADSPENASLQVWLEHTRYSCSTMMYIYVHTYMYMHSCKDEAYTYAHIYLYYWHCASHLQKTSHEFLHVHIFLFHYFQYFLPAGIHEALGIPPGASRSPDSSPTSATSAPHSMLNTATLPSRIVLTQECYRMVLASAAPPKPILITLVCLVQY